jgi:hypothetical protein
VSLVTQHRWGADCFGWIDSPGSEGDEMGFREKPGDGPVLVTFKVSIGGQVHGHSGVKRGDIVEVPTRKEAERLYAAGLAQPADVKTRGKPYVPYPCR